MSPPSESTAQPLSTRRLAWLAFWVAAAILAYEIALLRVLLLASWHHFAFLVISLALIGFGASGTALCFLARPLAAGRAPALLRAAALATGVLMPIATGLAMLLPVEARVAPATIMPQLAAWGAFFALLAIPFLLGGIALGAALAAAGGRVAICYGANLVGSALGATGAIGLMAIVPPAWLPVATAVPALVGAAAVRAPHGRVAWLIALVLGGAWLALFPPALRIDPWKYGAHVDRLVAQGDAEVIARHDGVRGRTEATRSAVLHDLPFLRPARGATVPVPSLAQITIDGHWAGAVIDARTTDEAGIVEHTLMAFPYTFVPEHAHVALLGETGSTNAWLALRHGARGVDVVQPHAAVFDVLRTALRESGGGVIDEPGVRTIVAEPRSHLDRTAGRYDLVQLVGLESSIAGSGGVGGLGQDFLVTVEGFRAALRSLTSEGVLALCRGVQTPPRDNVKLLATIIAALRAEGFDDPERHIVVVRDFLAVSIVARREPFTATEGERVRSACRDLGLTPVWFEGARPDELNRPDEFSPAPEGPGDWYHWAVSRLTGARADTFIDDYVFDVRPPTDDRPFFLDFGRLATLPALREAFGDMWLARVEAAYLIVLAATIVIAAAGALLVVAPLVFVRGVRRTRGKVATSAYFGAIGLAYMLIELACLSRFTVVIGDPVLTAALVIAAFLVVSGAGSLCAQRIGRSAERAVIVAAGGAIVTAGLLFAIPPSGGALLLVVPLSFAMGFPMALGLARLNIAAAPLVPWAWGVNGFASVLASPLATLLGMTWGFTPAAVAGIACYAVAAAVFGRLPRGTS